MNFFKFVLPIFLFISLQSCSSISNPTSPIADPTVCTTVFKMYDITVLSPDGEPADSVNLTFRYKTDGKQFKVCPADNNFCNNETTPFTVMHDGFLDSLSSSGEAITVMGQKGNHSFQAEFNFQPGPCHVQKVTGPDSVTLN